MSKLTLKQQKFADEYIINGNATVAYKLAYVSVKKDAVARTNGSRLLTNANVSEYIEERMEKLQSEKVADQQEILEFLTSVIRGEQTEQTLIGMGMGEQGVTDIEIASNQRIKAAELLGKRYAMWTDKKQVDLTEQVVFIGENDLED